MSLLMDALKKAELAKRQANGVSPTDEISKSSPLELVAQPEELRDAIETDTSALAQETPSPLPELPLRMEDLDSEFRAHQSPDLTIPSRQATELAESRLRPRQAPRDEAPPVRAIPKKQTPPKPVGTATTGQDAVKNLFAAKAASGAKKNHTFAIGVGLLTLLSSLGIGTYFWWQLQPRSGLSPIYPASSPPSPLAAVPAPQAAPTLAQAAAAAVPPAPTFETQPPPPPTEPITEENAGDDGPTSRAKPALASTTQTALTASSAPTPQEPAPNSPVKVTKARLRVNPSLAHGFELFQRGDLAASKIEYEKVLQFDPQNTDALHGMAAISLRKHRPEAAEHYFRRILIANPQDPNAIAGLANLRGQSNPAAAESRLKALPSAQQELAGPQFALGNLFAAEERWAEAQQAYFKAYSAEPGNPDILFNLAVSLEHLRQAKLATQYYLLAIEAAKHHAPGFDPAQATSRLKALQP